MGFFDNDYDRYGYDGSYSSIDESTITMPSYNNRYSNIHDMYEVACQLEIDGNDLIHEMDMNILMNEHNYFVEHGRSVQYSDRYGYLTEEGNSVWRFIQKMWETLMKYLDDCVSWVIDKCKEYIIYFKQLWATKWKLRDGIKGFGKSIKEAETKAADNAKKAISSIQDAVVACKLTEFDHEKMQAKPELEKGATKLEKSSVITKIIDDIVKTADTNESKEDMKNEILDKLKLKRVLGDDKGDKSDAYYWWHTTPGASETEIKALVAADENGFANSWKENTVNKIQASGEECYNLLQKEFSDNIAEIFKYIRESKKDLRDDRISNREQDGDNEEFDKIKRKIKAYNLCATYIMKSFSMKINICVSIVNKCVTCLKKIKDKLVAVKSESKASSSSGNNTSNTDNSKPDQQVGKSFLYKGGYQALF